MLWLDTSEASELTLLAGGLLGSLDTDAWEATGLTLLAGSEGHWRHRWPGRKAAHRLTTRCRCDVPDHSG